MARSIAFSAAPAVQRITSNVQLGAAIRAQRRSQRLRIDDAAALCGVATDVLSRLERGQGTVRLDSLLKVMDGLGLTFVLAPKGLSLSLEAGAPPLAPGPAGPILV